MNGIKGILFDFGGTLDTNGTHWGGFRKIAADFIVEISGFFTGR